MKEFHCLWSDRVEHTAADHDPSLTLTQFCSLLMTVLVCRAYHSNYHGNSVTVEAVMIAALREH